MIQSKQRLLAVWAFGLDIA